MGPMHIPVVEDDMKAAACLQKGLVESGFVVDVALHGSDGLHPANSGEYDPIILDVMRPHRDGRSVL